MNELITVSYNSDQPTGLGRDLHEALEVTTPYHKWFPRMCEYGFDEGKDYVVTDKNVHNSNGGKQTIIDHQLTIPMAKEICEQSDFLSGRSGNWQGCCFDWILKPSNLTKIVEGNYRNRREKDEECSGSFKDNRFGIDPDKLGIQL